MSDRSSTRKNWLWKNRKHKCYWCGRTLNKGSLTADHLIPLSKGGTHQRTNLVPACYQCNQAKRDMMPTDFAKVMAVAMRHS